jgi:CHAD domain-containing protein
MVVSKWAWDLRPDMKPAAAARRVLRRWLSVVRQQFRLAVEVRDGDVEHVHQLRVATRRCRAAVEAFQEVLRPRYQQRLRRLLRTIRRAAGTARDADVLLLDLRQRLESVPPVALPGMHWAAGQLVALRSQAQQDLRRAYEEQYPELKRAERFPSYAFAAGRKGRGTKGAARTVGELAQRLVLQQFDALQEASRAARSQSQLHQMRIESKKLRYLMEVFVRCFPKEFHDDLYPRVEELQEILGEINDAFNAAAVFQRMEDDCKLLYPREWPLWKEGVKVLVRIQRDRREAALARLRRFRDRWKQDGVSNRFRRIVRQGEA